MVNIIIAHNVVEANGKTVKENNLERGHKIPIGTLVEVNCHYLDEHRTRMFVARYERDCDGTPLYSVTHSREYCDDRIEYDSFGDRRDEYYIEIYRRENQRGGWSDDTLIVVTDDGLPGAMREGYKEALNDVVELAKLSPHLVHPLFIPAIEGLLATRDLINGIPNN